MGDFQHFKGSECIFSVVNDGDNGVIDIGTILEVIGVEHFHVVGVSFDIIRPTGGFDEGSTLIVAELVDGND